MQKLMSIMDIVDLHISLCPLWLVVLEAPLAPAFMVILCAKRRVYGDSMLCGVLVHELLV